MGQITELDERCCLRVLIDDGKRRLKCPGSMLFWAHLIGLSYILELICYWRCFQEDILQKK